MRPDTLDETVRKEALDATSRLVHVARFSVGRDLHAAVGSLEEARSHIEAALAAIRKHVAGDQS